ncbi:pleckstrin homology domain-containing family B member 1 [Pelobates fuscus]|uniref:pleckstrin homology domain-containing family B member 1 n=1 Tax=Pelobates fuscus TaxID=191477 RepID=UPI002FE43823
MALLKSGWLWRQSSILRRWKRHWFDLWIDGTLVYYPDEARGTYEERLLLKFHCTNIRAGAECEDIQLPEGGSRDALVMLQMQDHRVYLCAESEDDAVAWKMALDDAKYYPVYVYDPYDDSYQTVPMHDHHAVYTGHGYGHYGYMHGMPPVLVREDPYERRYGQQMALGMLAGAATGSAMSALMWLPCWF